MKDSGGGRGKCVRATRAHRVTPPSPRSHAPPPLSTLNTSGLRHWPIGARQGHSQQVWSSWARPPLACPRDGPHSAPLTGDESAVSWRRTDPPRSHTPTSDESTLHLKKFFLQIPRDAGGSDTDGEGEATADARAQDDASVDEELLATMMLDLDDVEAALTRKSKGGVSPSRYVWGQGWRVGGGGGGGGGGGHHANGHPLDTRPSPHTSCARSRPSGRTRQKVSILARSSAS